MKTIYKMWQASHLTLNLDLKFHVYTIHRGCIHFSEREALEPSHCVNVASQQCRAPQDQCSRRQLPRPWMFWGIVVILLMEEILHRLIGSLSHYFQVFFYILDGAGFFHQQYVTVCRCVNLSIFICRPSLKMYLKTLQKVSPSFHLWWLKSHCENITSVKQIADTCWYIKCGVSNLSKWLRKLSVLYMNHMYSGLIFLLIPLWSQNNSRTAWPSFSHRMSAWSKPKHVCVMALWKEAQTWAKCYLRQQHDKGPKPNWLRISSPNGMECCGCYPTTTGRLTLDLDTLES